MDPCPFCALAAGADDDLVALRTPEDGARGVPDAAMRARALAIL